MFDLIVIGGGPAGYLAAERAGWAPISFGSVLHDRASYRHHWLLLERERAAGNNLPPEVARWVP